MLDVKSYRLLESEFHLVATGTGIEPEAAEREARQTLGSLSSYTDFSDKLAELNEQAGVLEDKKPQDPKSLMARAVLAYSPMLEPGKASHVLGGTANALPLYGRYGTVNHLDFSTYDNPLGINIRQTLGVNPVKALVAANVRIPFSSEGIDNYSQTFTTLAEVVANAGNSSLRLLASEQGIEYFGRYGAYALTSQALRPEIGRNEREVPIYVAKYDERDALSHETYLYETLQNLAHLETARLHPKIYEVGSADSLYDALAMAKRPAFGFINGHGSPGAISLGTDEETLEVDDEVEHVGLAAVQARKNWRMSGGLAVFSCYGAQSGVGEEASVAENLSIALGVPILGATDICRRVDIETRQTRADQPMRVRVIFDEDRNGAQIVRPPDKRPAQAFKLVA